MKQEDGSMQLIPVELNENGGHSPTEYTVLYSTLIYKYTTTSARVMKEYMSCRPFGDILSLSVTIALIKSYFTYKVISTPYTGKDFIHTVMGLSIA